jgi:peptide/nickel transport system substrate-binding protein
MRLRLVAIALAATVACSVALGAASGAREARATPLLKVGWVGSLSTVDVTRTGLPFATGLVLESLMTLGPDGKTLRPNLATSVRHPNPFVYVYSLRKGVRFSDGRELTAADVANAMNYSRFPGSQAAGFYGSSVRTISATGRYTVQVTLRNRDASWPYVVADSFASGVFRKQFADEHGGQLGRPGILTIGTGPWKFDSLDPTRGIELSANPHYTRGSVPFDRISIKFFANETSMALALRSGEIDVAPQVFDVRAFDATSGVQASSGKSCWQLYFGMNTRSGPWSDVHVRRAVAYAINRADLIRASGKPQNMPTYTLIPTVDLNTIGSQSTVNALLKTVPRYAFDLTKARQEMARSAYPTGFTSTIPTYPLYNVPTVTEVLVAQLKAIGINLQISPLTTAAWAAQITVPDRRPPATPIMIACTSPDPGHLPNLMLRKAPANVANYNPPEVDALIRTGLRTVDPAKRLAVYGRLLKRLAADVPFVPLFVDTRNYASKDFTWETYDGIWTRRPWALEIKPK